MLASCKRAGLFFLALSFGLAVGTQTQTAVALQTGPAPLGKLIDVVGYRGHFYCIGTGSSPVVVGVRVRKGWD